MMRKSFELTGPHRGLERARAGPEGCAAPAECRCGVLGRGVRRRGSKRARRESGDTRLLHALALVICRNRLMPLRRPWAGARKRGKQKGASGDRLTGPKSASPYPGFRERNRPLDGAHIGGERGGAREGVVKRLPVRGAGNGQQGCADKNFVRDACASCASRLDTELYGSVCRSSPRSLVCGAVRCDPPRDHRSAWPSGRVDHQSRGQVPDDADRHEEARPGSGAGGARRHAEGRTGENLQAWDNAASRRRPSGSRRTASSSRPASKHLDEIISEMKQEEGDGSAS